jgi:branched-chain amino acid transport system permease protein
VPPAGAFLPLVFLVLASAPFWANSYYLYVINLVLIYAIAALGVDVVIGWTGQLHLAQPALFGVGAYGTAVALERGVPLGVCMVIASIIATAVGCIVAIPALRLSGFFVAIATLAFGYGIVKLFSAASSLTGGANGKIVEIWQLGVLTPEASIYFLTVVVYAVVMGLAWRALRGRFGRTLLAVYTLDTLTASVGISASRYRVTAFAIAGALGGVAGGLYAVFQTTLFPGMFETQLLIVMLVMVFVGGAGSIWGSSLGAAFAVGIVEFLHGAGALQNLIYGASLVVVIVFAPGGLVGLLRSLAERARPHRKGPIHAS